jgi:hypothetical protein
MSPADILRGHSRLPRLPWLARLDGYAPQPRRTALVGLAYLITFASVGAAEYQELQQFCIEDGLLRPAWGRGNYQISKKGREFVRAAMETDELVASAAKEALSSPRLERREALVALTMFAVQRMRERSPAE